MRGIHDRQRWRWPAWLLAAALPAICATAAGRGAIDDDVEHCRQDPRFRIGGAMIGDCLQERSDAVDREIEAALARGEQRYCLEEDREDYRRSHADWRAYRQRLCDLVERSPDNTPSYVNGAGCRLELGRQRLASLVYTNEYGSPRCPATD